MSLFPKLPPWTQYGRMCISALVIFYFLEPFMHYTWKNCGRSLGVSKVCQCSGIGLLMRVFKFSDLLLSGEWRGLWGSFLPLGTLIVVCSWLSLCGHSSPLFSLCSSPDSWMSVCLGVPEVDWGCPALFSKHISCCSLILLQFKKNFILRPQKQKAIITDQFLRTDNLNYLVKSSRLSTARFFTPWSPLFPILSHIFSCFLCPIFK